MSGDKNRIEWNEVIKLIPFDDEGDGYIAHGIDRFAEEVFRRKPEERVGFALKVAKELYGSSEYRKVVKLCDFITIQLVDADMSMISTGVTPEVLEVYDIKARSLCALEDSLMRDAEKAITANDVQTLEKLFDQITYTRHRKLWAYSDALSKQESTRHRLGRAKTYVDLGRREDAKRDLEVAKSTSKQKTFNLQLT